MSLCHPFESAWVRRWFHRCVSLSVAGMIAVVATAASADQPFVPGTGTPVERVGDDFEAEDWSYIFNGAKSSEEIDGQIRSPAGRSTNGRWYEGAKRGHPDIVRRVATPAEGLLGSEGALLLQSTHTGIPGRPSRRMQQDDFVCNVHYRMQGGIPVQQNPSIVTRVFLPPVAEWEKRTGPHFAFRASLETTVSKPGKGLFASGSSREKETYWPGMFIEFTSSEDSRQPYDSAALRIRGNRRGGDYVARQIEVTGWWTLGMSFTPDGQVHYYASPGVDELTAEDHLASEFPYSYRAETFRTFFFNVCSGDDGRTESTAWIVDDPTLYTMPRAARR